MSSDISQSTKSYNLVMNYYVHHLSAYCSATTSIEDNIYRRHRLRTNPISSVSDSTIFSWVRRTTEIVSQNDNDSVSHRTAFHRNSSLQDSNASPPRRHQSRDRDESPPRRKTHDMSSQRRQHGRSHEATRLRSRSRGLTHDTHFKMNTYGLHVRVKTSIIQRRDDDVSPRITQDDYMSPTSIRQGIVSTASIFRLKVADLIFGPRFDNGTVVVF